MTCPFAKYASKLPFGTAAGHATSYHHHHEKPGSSSSLSEALRIGTARSHRMVEKSKGVAMLLQSVSSPASPLTEGVHFDRSNYVQWNIMLACIYTVLEAALCKSRTHPLLAPLFEDDELMPLLVRTVPLLHDIDAHLSTLHEHTGATLADLAEHARDQPDHVQNARLRQALMAAVRYPDSYLEASLTTEHFDLLSTAQVDATLRYITALSTVTPSGLLLAHAYTRYLGDLSGGQHIYKKVAKNFPIPNSPDNIHRGFEFYHFSLGSTSDDVDACQDLKQRFRSAMEKGYNAGSGNVPLAETSRQLVAEANIAFDLNTALFESLLPVELRMANIDVEAVLDQAGASTMSKAALVHSANSPVFHVSGTLLAGLVVAALLYLSSSLQFPLV